MHLALVSSHIISSPCHLGELCHLRLSPGGARHDLFVAVARIRLDLQLDPPATKEEEMVEEEEEEGEEEEGG